MAARDQLIRSFQRKRKPPRDFRTTGAIPGFGGYQDATIARKIGQANARHDRTTRISGGQRAPYRPGERFKRKHPYGRGDASRPHRPRLS